MNPRERILKRASEMFISLGTKNVTMDLLATDMGISKRTIYELFKDKEDLIIESIQYMIMETNKENMRVISESSNVIEAIFEIMMRQETRRKQMPVVSQEDIKKYFPIAKARTFRGKDSFKKITAPLTLLKKGKDQGIFRMDLNIEVVDSFIFELISILHSSQLIRLLNPDQNDLFRSIVLPYFRGLCTAKGLELMHTYFEDNNPFTNE